MITKERTPTALLALTCILVLGAGTVGGSYIFLSSYSPKNLAFQRKGLKDTTRQPVALEEQRSNCGPLALKMILDHYATVSTLPQLQKEVGLTDKGSTMLAIKETAESKGLSVWGWRYTFKDLSKAHMPAIVFIHGNHFAVVDSITRTGVVFLRDPRAGKLVLPREKFLCIWKGETLVIRKQNSQGKAD